MEPRLHYEALEGSQLIVCNLFKEDKTDEVLTKIAEGQLTFGGPEFYAPVEGVNICVTALLKDADGNLCHITGEEKFCDRVQMMPIKFAAGTTKHTIDEGADGILYAAYGSANILVDVKERYEGGEREFFANNSEYSCGDPDPGADKMLFIYYRLKGEAPVVCVACEEGESAENKVIRLPDGLIVWRSE